MIGVLIHFQNIYSKNSTEIVCLTPVCKHAAGRILENLDYSVNPCDDFYNFSCGSYLKYKNTYDDQITAYTELGGYLASLKREVLENSKNPDEPQFVNKVKKYYESCLKKSPSVRELVEIFLNVTEFGDWPLSETYPMKLEETIAKLIIYSDSGFIVYVYTRYKDGLLEHIGIVPDGTTINEDGLLNSTDENSILLKEQYFDLFRYVFRKLDLKDEDADAITQEIIEVETALANLTIRDDTKTNTTTMTVLELDHNCSSISWTSVFENIYHYLDSSGNYSENLTISISDMGYMEDICLFVENNDPRIIYNLIVWNLLAKALSRTDFIFSQLVNIMRMDSKISLSEPLSNKLTWKVCITNFEFIYDFGLRYMLLQAEDYEEKIKKMEDYVKQILSESENIFSRESWIDDYSKNITRLMVTNTKYGIGHDNSSADEQKLYKLFEKLNVSDNYLHNILDARKQLFADFLFNGVINQYIHLDETFNPFVVNAYFFRGGLNARILLPLGIMLPPFYSHGAPNYLNFGSIGRIIGHEISHNFDNLEMNETSKKDEDNNVTITWPKDFLEEYTKRKLCLINQYSKFILEGNTTLDGNSSIRDNIADNSGMIQAYWAYDKFLRKHGKEPRLPGLHYTNRQMFFIAYAQTKCEKLDSVKEFYDHASHSPGRHRILIPLMNFPEFSKIFNCPLDSYMNPEEKCKLWG